MAGPFRPSCWSFPMRRILCLHLPNLPTDQAQRLNARLLDDEERREGTKPRRHEGRNKSDEAARHGGQAARRRAEGDRRGSEIRNSQSRSGVAVATTIQNQSAIRNLARESPWRPQSAIALTCRIGAAVRIERCCPRAAALGVR